jgi:uncharacterized protein YigE (DUF2233 family)
LPDPDRTVWPGVINRFQQKAVIPEAQLAGPVIGFHLDPKRIAFRVHYTPGRAKYISEWAAQLSRSGDTPLLVFPAGFFTGDNLASGLLVADGYRYSQSYDFGGVFVVRGGQPGLRWLDPQPIKAGEEFEQAVQAFPVYVSRGVIPPLNEHDTRAPRTVVAESRGGDFLVLFSLTPLFRTTEMARWLINSDLEIYNALNLDGGRSAGYWAGEGDQVDSFVPLPAVIAVYAK